MRCDPAMMMIGTPVALIVRKMIYIEAPLVSFLELS
jgi:hypothetical protein